MVTSRRSLQNTLRENGFSDKEAVVYLSMLELGEATPAEIARHSGQKRPTTYLLLEQLRARGIVSSVTRDRKLLFRAIHPDNLIERRYQQFSKLRGVAGDLATLVGESELKPQTSVFEGVDGLIHMMEDTLLAKNKEILFWADMRLVTEVFREYWQTYIQKRVERGIWARGIVSDNREGRVFQARGKAELREAYLISRAHFPLENEINIYDDKVAIISHEDLVGVVIHNRRIAATQRSIFKLCFAAAKTLRQ